MQNGDKVSVQFFAVTHASVLRRISHRRDRLARGAASWGADHTPSWRNIGASTAQCRRHGSVKSRFRLHALQTRALAINGGNKSGVHNGAAPSAPPTSLRPLRRVSLSGQTPCAEDRFCAASPDFVKAPGKAWWVASAGKGGSLIHGEWGLVIQQICIFCRV